MKKYHFVYKTVCQITNHYYLGVHSTNNINDDYLGSGIKFLNYVKKYGKQNFTRQIIKTCSSRDEAFEYEKQLLTDTILHDDKCLNLIEGGRGSEHNYDETFRDRISKTRMVRIQEGKIIPTKHTEEHKQRLRENNPGGAATAKPLYQINTLGYVVNTWPSSRKAGIVLQLKSWRNLSMLANKKLPQTAYGFYWRWVGDGDVVDGRLTTINTLESIRADNAARAGRRIEQRTLSGQPVKIWKNMCEAARALGVDNSAISVAIKAKRPCRGFYWSRIEQRI